MSKIINKIRGIQDKVCTKCGEAKPRVGFEKEMVLERCKLVCSNDHHIRTVLGIQKVWQTALDTSVPSSNFSLSENV